MNWAILLDDGRLVHGGQPGQPEPVSTEKPVAVPLELFDMLQGTFILTTDPVLGPTFVWL